GPARVARVCKAQLLLERERIRIELPAGGGMRARGLAEHGREGFDRARELPARPGRIGGRNAVLPAYVVVTMHADLEPRVPYRTHRGACARADVRPWQERAVEERPHAVMRGDGGAAHLAEKAAPEDAPERTPRMIRPDAEVERRRQFQPLQKRCERRHAFERAAQRIDVYFERDAAYTHRRALGSRAALVRAHPASTSARAAGRFARYDSKMLRTAAGMSIRGVQPSSVVVFSIHGTRLRTSW